MPTRSSFDYATIRVVPRVEREEFVNVGVVLLCRQRAYLGMRIELNRERLRTLAPNLDLDAVERYLAGLQRICAGEADAGPIARLAQAERFHWLVSPSSTVVQPSPVHSGICDNPEQALEKLMRELVLAPDISL